MEFKIKSDNGNVKVLVRLSTWKFLQEVDVWQQKNHELTGIKFIQKAMISFSSYGKLEPNDARSYAKAILKACDIADEINAGRKQAEELKMCERNYQAYVKLLARNKELEEKNKKLTERNEHLKIYAYHDHECRFYYGNQACTCGYQC